MPLLCEWWLEKWSFWPAFEFSGGSLSMLGSVGHMGSTVSSPRAETVAYSAFARPWDSLLLSSSLKNGPKPPVPWVPSDPGDPSPALTSWYSPSFPSNIITGKRGLSLVRDRVGPGRGHSLHAGRLQSAAAAPCGQVEGAMGMTELKAFPENIIAGDKSTYRSTNIGDIAVKYKNPLPLPSTSRGHWSPARPAGEN